MDGLAIVQALGKPKNAFSFGDLADSFSSAVFKNFTSIPKCTRVDVPFDHYKQDSIKNAMQEKRDEKKYLSVE